MYIVLGVCSIIAAFYGIYRSFRKKDMLVFIWIIVEYYTIISLVSSLSPENLQVSEDIKNTYMLSMLLCVGGFLLSDFLFNRKEKKTVSLDALLSNKKIWLYIEIVYWISMGLTYFTLIEIDYIEYNTNNKGGGWAQCFFQLSACINFVFVYKKKYLKLFISILTVFVIIEAIQVRSFLYFPLMPVVFFYLYKNITSVSSFKKFIKSSVPIIALLLVAAIALSLTRFGEFKMPEAELTSIAFNSIDKWYLGDQYFISTGHYFYRLLGPIVNMLSHFGINIESPVEMFPSVPRINAMLFSGLNSVDFLENASHMPGTIFLDLYVSWGYWGGFYAVVIYFFFIKIFGWLQKDAFTLVLFSAIAGWHFYMLLRGSVDTCSSGIGYAFWMSLIIYWIFRYSQSRKK